MRYTDSSPNIKGRKTSIGAAFSEQGFNEDLEKNADIALYKVKQNGRGNIAFFKKIVKG